MRIRAVAHDDDAADGFAPAIGLGNAASHIRTELDGGHIAQQNRHAFVAEADGNLFQVVEAGDVAFDAQDEFTFRQFQRTAADFAVAAFDGRADIFQREVIGAQLRRIHRHLVLFLKAADRGDFRHAGHGRKLIFQIPILH